MFSFLKHYRITLAKRFIEWLGLKERSQDLLVQSNPSGTGKIAQHWMSSLDGPKSGTLALSFERLVVPVLPWEESSAAK